MRILSACETLFFMQPFVFCILLDTIEHARSSTNESVQSLACSICGWANSNASHRADQTGRDWKPNDLKPVDWKQIDATISELRLHFGSGYRIYFTRRERNVVLLLVGGDKASQQRDIQKGDIQKARRIAATLIELP